MAATRFLVRESYTGLLERTALTASGVAVFVPALWLLVAAEGSGIADVVAFAIPMTIWLSAFLPALRRNRWMIQSAAGLLLMVTPAILNSSPPWIQPTIIGFAVLVGVIFAAPLRLAVVLVAGVFLIDVGLSLGDYPAVAFATGTLMQRLVGPMLLLLAGMGLTLTMREWLSGASAVDEYEESIRRAISAEHAALRSRIAQDAVRRRVHETVLNTMNAIGLGLPPESADTARRSCARDLAELDVEIDIELDRSVSDVVHDAVTRCSADGFGVVLDCTASSPVEGLVALALRDAVVEAIRNVQRHSGANEANVRVRDEGASIIVTIEDDGVGVSQTALEGFGLRNALRSGIEAIGGSVEVVRRQGRGTRVCLVVPALASFPASGYPVRQFTEASSLGRVGLLGTPLFLVVSIGILTSGWSEPWPVRVAVGTHFALSVLLVGAWRTRARFPLSLAGCCAVWVIALATGPATEACSNSESIGWLLLALAGGGSFALVLSQRNPASAVAVVAVVAAASGWVVVGVPAACQTFPLLGAGVGLSYLVAVGVALWIADGLLEMRRVEAMAAWDVAEREHLSRVARVRAQREWAVVDEQARGMLLQVAEGGLDPAGAEAQAQAVEIGALLRSRLTRAPEPTRPVADVIALVQDIASTTGARVRVTVAGGLLREDPYPPTLLATLVDALVGVEAVAIQIHAFVEDDVEEIVVACEGPGAVPMTPHATGDAVLEIGGRDEDEPGFVASLRRPASQWRQATPAALR